MPDVRYGYCHCGCGQKTKLAIQNHTAKGWIRGEPFRYLAGHGKRSSPVEYHVEDRGYVTPCWAWQRGIAPNGYAHMTLPGGRGASAHKVYYERAHGPVPAGVHLDHLCRQRDCVNPGHLEVVTCAENARRGLNTKLTYAQVDEIRALRAEGVRQQDVADIFGVHRITISDIERGRTWSAPGGVVT